MGIFSGGDQKKAYKKAAEQSEKYYQEANRIGKPYVNEGMKYAPGLNDAFENLSNPAQLQEEWAAGYQESPYAKLMREQNTASGLDIASSNGLLGSSAALQNIQAGAGAISAADRQKYMDDLMQKYLASIGLGQNMYNTGVNTAGNLMTNAMNHGNNMADLTYGQYATGSNNPWASILGNAAGVAGTAFGVPVLGAVGKAGADAVTGYMGWQNGSTTGGVGKGASYGGSGGYR